MSTVSVGKIGSYDIVSEINSEDCGYVAPQVAGTVIAEFCDGQNEMVRYADGHGNTFDMAIAINSERCGHVPNPEEGTVLSTSCQGTSQVTVYADGKGGSYNKVTAQNSPECGYTAPVPTTPTTPTPTTPTPTTPTTPTTPSFPPPPTTSTIDRNAIPIFIHEVGTLIGTATVRRYADGSVYIRDIVSGYVVGFAMLGTPYIRGIRFGNTWANMSKKTEGYLVSTSMSEGTFQNVTSLSAMIESNEFGG